MRDIVLWGSGWCQSLQTLKGHMRDTVSWDSRWCQSLQTLKGNWREDASWLENDRVGDTSSLQFHFKPSGEAFITLFVWCPSTEHMVKYHGTQCCLQRHGHQPAQLKISLTWSHTAGPTKNTTLLHRNGRFVLLACLRNYRKLQRWLMFNAPILVWAVSQHTNTRNNSKNIH